MSLPLFVPADDPHAPSGLRYLPDFVEPREESELVAAIAELDFQDVVMHGVAARRTTVHYGYSYDYDTRQASALDPERPNAAQPIPEFLLALRRRAAELIEVSAEALAEALVTRYPPGATIGWHRDAPMFGPSVVGVSLLSPCDMRFRRRAGAGFARYKQRLERRSAYVLSGAARAVWQHSIPAVAALRYSITFRTVRAVR
jgi:alkylated DNA repair dioxygenase AlkB